MARNIPTILAISLILASACGEQEIVQPQEELSLFGKWRFSSHILSGCDLAEDNLESRCTGSAVECGVLTLSEGAWSWEQSARGASVFKETGGYYLSGNSIFLTSAESPGPHGYSISGSNIMFTKTTLTFTNYGISDGCTYTDSYIRYNQTVVPSK
jgi:hypothetical protein